jgi:hypothetical protein
MAREYPVFGYSMNAVRKVGDRLAGKVVVTNDETYRDALDVFAVANSWRDSHFLPMRSTSISVRYKMRKEGISGDMASRPKRMASIRRKLRESSTKLDQMQDIAGCRAILDDIAGVRRLTQMIRDDFPHELSREWGYIDAPKEDGYRSHHLVFKFQPRNSAQRVYEDRKIELQIRTRLQHSWATAVEAVGLFNGEDLKHHHGSGDWLRFFKLVSGEFAHVEGCEPGVGMPNRRERIEEIKDLNARIGAVGLLQNIRTTTHYAENFIYERGKYFLIVYKADHTVNVENFDSPTLVSARLARVERENAEGQTGAKAVVVEVDKVENLIRTYPNYFGDVSLFVRNLRRIIKGQDAQEYTLTPQQVVKPRPHETPDPSLLVRRYGHWGEIRRR